MKIIVLHDRYSNEPVVIRVDAIDAIKKVKDGDEEYSDLYINGVYQTIKETIGTIMTKIRKVESEDNE